MKPEKMMLPKESLWLVALLLMLNVSCGEERQTTVENEDLTEENTETEETEDYIVDADWDYENINWEEMEDTECHMAVQSPVDIRPEEAIEARLPEIQYEYEPFQMNVVNNGYTVQGSGAENSFMSIGDKRYKFVQFHFHNPSEHTLNGQTFPLVMHLVHQEEGSDNLAVIGIFAEEGQENEFLRGVLDRVPSEEKVEEETDFTVDLDNLIPQTDTYYTYIGSLTTPPCTAGVDWILFDQPVEVSAEQIAKFTEQYGNTSRPIQPLNNRRVYTTLK